MRSARALPFLFVLAFPLLSSSAYELNDVLSKLETHQKAINGIRFDFHQEFEFVSMDTKEIVKGNAHFEHPNKLRIEKDKPQKQLTISDGKKIWVYNPKFQQVWVGPWKNWAHSSTFPKGMVPLNNYVKLLKKEFHLHLISEKAMKEGSLVVIKAVPKDKHQAYQLDLYISTESWLLSQTHFQSDSANVITRLSKHELNPKTTKSYFQFDPPTGVDVIPLN